MSEQGTIRTVVWGTGNVGRAAIRAVDAHPALELAGVIVHNPEKVGLDAGDLGEVGRTLGVPATADIDAALADAEAVVYAASGDIRPDDALLVVFLFRRRGRGRGLVGDDRHRDLGAGVVELLVEQRDVVALLVEGVVVLEHVLFEVVVQLGFVFYEFFVAHQGSERRP